METKVSYVDEFDNKEGIQISTDKDQNDMKFYSAYVKTNVEALIKIIPMNKDKNYVEKRAKELKRKQESQAKAFLFLRG
jgi:hypothetical protein